MVSATNWVKRRGDAHLTFKSLRSLRDDFNLVIILVKIAKDWQSRSSCPGVTFNECLRSLGPIVGSSYSLGRRSTLRLGFLLFHYKYQARSWAHALRISPPTPETIHTAIAPFVCSSPSDHRTCDALTWTKDPPTSLATMKSVQSGRLSALPLIQPTLDYSV